ncbi:MAG: sensor histidine kinase, partial [Actinobacteria bacterium]|nr:sensor histidine kinase [Actinomycetota bacterium]
SVRGVRRRTAMILDEAGLDRAAAAALVALGWFEAAFGQGVVHPWEQALLTLGWTVPLIWRRRWPVAVLAMVVPFGPILDLVNEQGGVTSYVLAVIFASFTVGRHRDRPVTWAGPVLGVGFFWVMAALTGGHFSDYLFTALLYGGAWGVGYALRQRATRISELDQEAQDLRERQAEREQRAITEERGRIARELHDIVSHSISVITIQAQAVRRRLHPDQTSEIDDLQDIEETARQAMAEMRRLLGVLRADGPAALAPQPGLEQLGRLIADTRAAGVVVDVRTEGDPVALPPGLDLTAYRVVQEALTNCRKHAPGASTAVVIRYDHDCVELQIENDGGDVPVSAADDGHGLIGMRERVALYGGTLEAGPGADGGFAVRARLPRRQEAPV